MFPARQLSHCRKLNQMTLMHGRVRMFARKSYGMPQLPAPPPAALPLLRLLNLFSSPSSPHLGQQPHEHPRHLFSGNCRLSFNAQRSTRRPPSFPSFSTSPSSCLAYSGSRESESSRLSACLRLQNRSGAADGVVVDLEGKEPEVGKRKDEKVVNGLVDRLSRQRTAGGSKSRVSAGRR